MNSATLTRTVATTAMTVAQQDTGHEQNQRERRIPVSIDVQVESVLAGGPATITDLTSGGAKIVGRTHPVGTKLRIEMAGGIVWGRVKWSEEDRFGVQFETQMPEHLQSILTNRTPANDRTQTVRRFGKRVAI